MAQEYRMAIATETALEVYDSAAAALAASAFRFLRYAGLVILALGDSSVSAAPPATAATSATIATSHTLAKEVAGLGAFACAERANQVATFLAGGSRGPVFLNAPPDNANSRLLMSTLLIPIANQENSLATITLAPNQANGCGASYQAVTYVDKNCAKALSASYPKVKFQVVGKTDIQFGLIESNANVFGMPAGDGCILIKQETVQ